MAEYLERETLIAWFMPYAHTGESVEADVVISDIKGMKAADVAPVVHGRWIEHIDDYENWCECSVCHGSSDSPLDTTPYCPNCGARMDGADE